MDEQYRDNQCFYDVIFILNVKIFEHFIYVKRVNRFRIFIFATFLLKCNLIFSFIIEIMKFLLCSIKTKWRKILLPKNVCFKVIYFASMFADLIL